jgi:glutamyl-tRNA synthetase
MPGSFSARAPRGRFAPSPTGPLHLGNAWAALLGWLWARAEGGHFALRIEDLDAARCRPEYVEALRRDLDWLGLDFDGPVVFQGRRGELYRAALERLTREGRAYPCFCSRAEAARAASAPHGRAEDGPVYPGTCAALSAAQVAERSRTRPPALRFRTAPGVEAFQDAVFGQTTQDVQAEVGDFVVRRTDGVASYQLAVVVDDADMGVDQVLRGADLLDSTPRQLQLARTLDLPTPVHAHVPLLLGADGRRLAKRAGPPTLTELREAGVGAERVVGLLARWAGLAEGGPQRPEELVSGFSLAVLPRSPMKVDAAEVRASLDPSG